MGRLSQPPRTIGVAPRKVSYANQIEQGPPTHQSSAPWRAWYKTARWRALRLTIFLRDQYTCRMCGRLEGDTSLLVCDHRRPHRGSAALFWDETNLQTLCKSPCHDQHKQAQEQASRHQAGVWD